MIGCRKTTPHSEHWYSAAPSASQTVSTMRRRTPPCPNGHGTSATGASADQSANDRGSGDRGPGHVDRRQGAEVVARRRDELGLTAHRGAEVLQDGDVADLVLVR